MAPSPAPAPMVTARATSPEGLCRSQSHKRSLGRDGSVSVRTDSTILPTKERARMAQDLRSFLDLVKRRKPDELQIVSKPIDARYEITGLVAKLEKEGRRRPVLLFENVTSTTFPVLTNLHASRSRLAAAINAAPDKMQETYLRAMDKPIAPRVVKTGPVKEVIRRGAEVDLLSLPQIVHHDRDAGPYITASISFAKDPTGETWNCAYNRLMVMGRDRTSIHLTLGKHLWEF